MEEKNELQAEVSVMSKRVKQSSELLSRLHQEEDLWTRKLEQLPTENSELFGNVLLASAATAYCGPLRTDTRNRLLRVWSKILQEHEILFTKNQLERNDFLGNFEFDPCRHIFNELDLLRWEHSGMSKDMTTCMTISLLFAIMEQRECPTLIDESGLLHASIALTLKARGKKVAHCQSTKSFDEDLREAMSDGSVLFIDLNKVDRHSIEHLMKPIFNLQHLPFNVEETETVGEEESGSNDDCNSENSDDDDKVEADPNIRTIIVDGDSFALHNDFRVLFLTDSITKAPFSSRAVVFECPEEFLRKQFLWLYACEMLPDETSSWFKARSKRLKVQAELEGFEEKILQLICDASNSGEEEEEEKVVSLMIDSKKRESELENMLGAVKSDEEKCFGKLCALESLADASVHLHTSAMAIRKVSAFYAFSLEWMMLSVTSMLRYFKILTSKVKEGGQKRKQRGGKARKDEFGLHPARDFALLYSFLSNFDREMIAERVDVEVEKYRRESQSEDGEVMDEKTAEGTQAAAGEPLSFRSALEKTEAYMISDISERAFATLDRDHKRLFAIFSSSKFLIAKGWASEADAAILFQIIESAYGIGETSSNAPARHSPLQDQLSFIKSRASMLDHLEVFKGLLKYIENLDAETSTEWNIFFYAKRMFVEGAAEMIPHPWGTRLRPFHACMLMMCFRPDLIIGQLDIELLKLVGTNDTWSAAMSSLPSFETLQVEASSRPTLQPILVRCTSVGLYSDFITNFEKYYTHFQRFHGGHRQLGRLNATPETVLDVRQAVESARSSGQWILLQGVQNAPSVLRWLATFMQGEAAGTIEEKHNKRFRVWIPILSAAGDTMETFPDHLLHNSVKYSYDGELPFGQSLRRAFASLIDTHTLDLDLMSDSAMTNCEIPADFPLRHVQHIPRRKLLDLVNDALNSDSELSYRRIWRRLLYGLLVFHSCASIRMSNGAVSLAHLEDAMSRLSVHCRRAFIEAYFDGSMQQKSGAGRRARSVNLEPHQRINYATVRYCIAGIYAGATANALDEEIVEHLLRSMICPDAAIKGVYPHCWGIEESLSRPFQLPMDIEPDPNRRKGGGGGGRRRKAKRLDPVADTSSALQRYSEHIETLTEVGTAEAAGLDFWRQRELCHDQMKNLGQTLRILFGDHMAAAAPAVRNAAMVAHEFDNELVGMAATLAKEVTRDVMDIAEHSSIDHALDYAVLEELVEMEQRIASIRILVHEFLKVCHARGPWTDPAFKDAVSMLKQGILPTEWSVFRSERKICTVRDCTSNLHARLNYFCDEISATNIKLAYFVHPETLFLRMKISAARRENVEESKIIFQCSAKVAGSVSNEDAVEGHKTICRSLRLVGGKVNKEMVLSKEGTLCVVDVQCDCILSERAQEMTNAETFIDVQIIGFEALSMQVRLALHDERMKDACRKAGLTIRIGSF